MRLSTHWDCLPQTVQDLRDRAAECELWAASKIDALDRDALLHAAACWRAMANVDERLAFQTQAAAWQDLAVARKSD